MGQGLVVPHQSRRRYISEEEYQATEELTNGFYKTADELNKEAPRTEKLTLYRGFTIPELKGINEEMALKQKIGSYNDVLPSSATWQRTEAIKMSLPRDKEDVVLLYMLIPPKHLIVIMSYPNNENPKDEKPKALDLKQAEVLIAASSYKSVELYSTETLRNGNKRYHVRVELAEMAREEVSKGISKARKEAEKTRKPKEETVDIAVEKLADIFGKKIAENIKAGKEKQKFQTLKGENLVLEIYDAFECTFSKQSKKSVNIGSAYAELVRSLATSDGFWRETQHIPFHPTL